MHRDRRLIRERVSLATLAAHAFHLLTNAWHPMMR